MMGSMIEEQKSKSRQTDLDHTSPYVMLPDLRKKYLSNPSKLVQSFLSMSSKKKQDYIEDNEQHEQTIRILSNEPILSARVIFIADHFRISKQQGIFAKVCLNENIVFKRYSKLTGEYKRRYLIDIGLIQSRDAAGNKNYEYYMETISSQLHTKRGNYRFLEDKHDYIQWMFPNHYQSMFNSHSYPMGYLEVQLFNQSRDLGKKMLESIGIFFDFMGLFLSKNLQFQIVCERRLRDVLLVNSHNHLRLRRILACLSITGFRLIALRLIQFLKFVVNEAPAYERLKRTFLRQWNIYGDDNKQEALKLCFHPDEDFPNPHVALIQFFSGTMSEKIVKNKQALEEKRPHGRGKVQNFDSSSNRSYSSSSSSSQIDKGKANKNKKSKQDQSDSQMVEEKYQKNRQQKPIEPQQVGTMNIPGISKQSQVTNQKEKEQKAVVVEQKPSPENSLVTPEPPQSQFKQTKQK